MSRGIPQWTDAKNSTYTVHRAGLVRCWAQLGTISVGPGSQSTFTKICRIGRGAQLGAIGPIGLRPALTVHTVSNEMQIKLNRAKTTPTYYG